ncbi:MAG: hypothetical protein KF819_07880 [Labilithrix sp.]|nr:hypothetical protein [Labilithrix sp.]
MTPSRAVRLLALAATALGVVSAVACGTEPVGVESCRQIERARCENARSCGIDLSRPVHRGDTPSQDVGACIRYYEDACLHGLVAPADPGAVAVQACVDAINNTPDCEIVKAPERHPLCSFLIPPAPPPAPPPEDAAADAAAE